MYTYISYLRNLLYEKGIFKASEFDIPVINIGNLSVGGSGKTPMLEYIIRLLSENYKIASLSRGYGRKTNNIREVFADSTVEECGDEPLQIKRKFPDTKVFVGINRVEAITQILFEYPDIDVILLDDALQHRAIKAGLNIILTEYSKIFTRDKSMPFGRLREKAVASKRGQIVVVTKCPENLHTEEKELLKDEISGFTDAEIFFSKITYGNFDLAFGNKIINNKTSKILILTAIANPKPLHDYISKKYNPEIAKKLKYRDHYNFSKKDVQKIIDTYKNMGDEAIIITTEKDLTRLKTFEDYFKDIPIYSIGIKSIILDDYSKKFNTIIENYVRENKSDNIIY